MIETIDNAIQLIVTGACTVIAFVNAVRLRERAWTLLGLFSGIFFLGDLYWELYLVFYRTTPRYSYIADFSWYAAYLFLIMLTVYVRKERKPFRPCHWSFVTIPVFTVGSCLFFMQRGDYASNIVSMVLMTLILVSIAGELFSARKDEQNGPSRRRFSFVVLLFCIAEYGMWFTSCFWAGDTIWNLYFWFDYLLSLTFILFVCSVRKVVER